MADAPVETPDKGLPPVGGFGGAAWLREQGNPGGQDMRCGQATPMVLYNTDSTASLCKTAALGPSVPRNADRPGAWGDIGTR